VFPGDTILERGSVSMKIHSLSGSEPHPSWGGWDGFISKRCELRDSFMGVKQYGATNCNYIVFPDGMMVANYGYHGDSFMARVRDEGVEKVRAEVVKEHQEFVALRVKLGI
jgi:hypothetical protein